MFKKPLTVKSSTNQRNSDRKKLFARFPSGSVDAFPGKTTFSLSKVVTHHQLEVSIYFSDRTPVFFQVSHDPNLYPSLYLLWLAPKAVPMLLIHAPVMEFIRNGADLMLPGVFVHPDYRFPEFESNSPISIGVYSPKLDTVLGPVAVGKALISSQEMLSGQQKGRCVAVMHTHQDQLWEAGPKGAAPVHQLDRLFQSNDSNLIQSLSDVLEQATLEVTEPEDAQQGDDAPESQLAEPSTEENDEKLKKFFFWTLRHNVDGELLPLDVGQFYAVYLLKKLPEGERLDLKKTSFKKFSTFLKKINDECDGNLLTITTKKGVDSITQIDFGHPRIKSAEDVEGATCSMNAKTSIPRVSECFSVTEAALPILSKAGYRRGDIIQPNQLRDVVLQYAKTNNLLRNNDKQVELDDQLQIMVRHFLPAQFPLNDLVQKIGALMSKAVAVTMSDGRRNVTRNKDPAVVFKVEKRSGNKTVTLVNSFVFFGIEPKALAQRIQTAMATGASINPEAPNCEGPQLLVHGNHVTYIADLLQKEFGVPKKYIKGLELGVKQKKGKK